MEHACPSCYSCGMPFKKPSDHAMGDVNQKYCAHCVDQQGQLKPYEEILNGTVNFLVHSQGLAMNAAMQMAKDLLAKQPAWRDLQLSLTKNNKQGEI